MCVCVWRWVGESERMCGGNTHRSTERDRKKQKAERDSGGERREPVKQPTVFLPLFHLRDPHEAQLGYASWTSAPPPVGPLLLQLLCVSMEMENMPADDCVPCRKAFMEAMIQQNLKVCR